MGTYIRGERILLLSYMGECGGQQFRIQFDSKPVFVVPVPAGV